LKWDRNGLTLELWEVELISTIIILFFYFLLIAPLFGSDPAVFDEKYVPNVVTGLATVAGILTAFVGFWIAHIYSNFEIKSKKFLFSRMTKMVAILFFGLLIVVFGLSTMVYGNPRASYAISLLGTAVTILVSIDVLVLLYYRGFEDSPDKE